MVDSLLTADRSPLSTQDRRFPHCSSSAIQTCGSSASIKLYLDVHSEQSVLILAYHLITEHLSRATACTCARHFSSGLRLSFFNVVAHGPSFAEKKTADSAFLDRAIYDF